MKWFRFLAVLLVLFAGCFPAAGAEGLSGEKGAVVLVLSGGGTRGFAHVGVLQVLEEEGIPLAGIVGTSMGSIIGGLAACGYSGEELEDVIRELDLTELLRDSSQGSKKGGDVPGEQSLMRLEFDKSWKITGPLGGLDGKNFTDRLYRLVRHASIYSFSDLRLPYAAIATDLETGDAVTITSGDIVSAMRASMSIPGLFEPWEIEGRLLVDGGLVANTPVSEAKRLFPGYPVIAVDVTSRGKTREQIRTVLDVIDQMITVMTDQNVEQALAEADMVITPDVGKEPMLSTRGWEKTILEGRLAAETSMAALRAVASGAPAPRERGTGGEPPVVADVRVTGLDGFERMVALKMCEEWKGNPLDLREVDRVCRNLRERENIRVVEYSVEETAAGETEIVLAVRKKAAREFSMSGYASNLDPYRRLYMDMANRDVFAQGDLLTAGIGIGDNWETYTEYLGPVRHGRRRTSLFLYGSREERETAGSGNDSWEQYRAALGERFYWGPFRMFLGYMVQQVDAGGMHNSHGPFLSFAWDNMDDPIDPNRGFELGGYAWFTGDGEILGRLEFSAINPVDESWDFFARGGAIFGDRGEPWNAAYLGARRELLSLADNPIKGDNVLWAGFGARRLFRESWWGRVYVDLFATGGRVYRQGWSDAGDSWEAGLGLTLPGRFLDGRIFVVYDNEGEWTFGYSLGRPRRDGSLPSP